MCLVAALLVVSVPAATAQTTLPDVLGTTILNNVLTGIALPQVPVPDPTTGDPAQPEETQPPPPPPQPATVPAAPAHPLGYYCKDESKRHLRGSKGTPFSRCVTALGRLRDGTESSPREACASLSRKRFPGMKRTPFAVCVAGGRALLADRQNQ